MKRRQIREGGKNAVKPMPSFPRRRESRFVRTSNRSNCIFHPVGQKYQNSNQHGNLCAVIPTQAGI